MNWTTYKTKSGEHWSWVILTSLKVDKDFINTINNNPQLESLIDTLGTLIKDYEDRNITEPDADPIGVLQYLMEEHQLKQSDLHELGSQGVVSEILNGKRQLNIRQIKALSERFHVSPAVFI